MNTQELFNEYISDRNLPEGNINRTMLGKNEIFSFERKINKQFIDFTEDDFLNFYKDISGKYHSFVQFSVAYKDVFNWYINKYEVVKNPFGRAKLKDGNVRKECITTTITNRIFQNAIADVRREYSTEYADIVELTMRLFYDGFRDSTEVVKMTEKDVNSAEKTVNLGYKTVNLSDKTILLLQAVNERKYVDTDLCRFYAKDYRGSYYKFLIRWQKIDTFDDLSLDRIKIKMYNLIQRLVKMKFGYKFRISDIFYLGFYNYLVEKYGKDTVKQFAFCDGRSVQTINIQEEIEKYGFSAKTIVLKRLCAEIITGEEHEERTD